MDHELYIQITMDAKEFFYTVAEMRSAQKAYFATRKNNVFRAARKLEDKVDAEIDRVREILRSMEEAEA